MNLRASFSSSLIIPVILGFLVGAICLYWYAKFDSRMPIVEAELAKLESAIKLVDCPSYNKGAILSIARESAEQEGRFADLFLIVGLLFFFVGIVNISVVHSHIQKNATNSGSGTKPGDKGPGSN